MDDFEFSAAWGAVEALESLSRNDAWSVAKRALMIADLPDTFDTIAELRAALIRATAHLADHLDQL